jgi:hypothetical protein
MAICFFSLGVLFARRVVGFPRFDILLADNDLDPLVNDIAANFVSRLAEEADEAICFSGFPVFLEREPSPPDYFGDLVFHTVNRTAHSVASAMLSPVSKISV